MGTTRNLYEKYARCVVGIQVRTENGREGIGTGFHIGSGYIVTARHVVEQNTVVAITEGRMGSAVCAGEEVLRIFYPPDDQVDLAVLATGLGSYWHANKPRVIMGDHELEIAEFIPLGGHLDDWLGDQLVMTKTLLLGFPPVPFSIYPVMVAAEGEVNAIIDKDVGPHPHFILSAMPRGGFSGGPVISEYDFLLGVVTESLYGRRGVPELGFLSAISIEPLLVLLAQNELAIPGNENVLLNGSL